MRKAPTQRQIAMRNVPSFDDAIATFKDQQQLIMENGIFSAGVLDAAGWSVDLVADDVRVVRIPLTVGPILHDSAVPFDGPTTKVREVELKSFGIGYSLTCSAADAPRVVEYLRASGVEATYNVARKPSIGMIRAVLRVFGYNAKRMPISGARAVERRLRRVEVRWVVALPIGIDKDSKKLFVPARRGYARPFLLGEAVRMTFGEGAWREMKAARHARARAAAPAPR
jgi:hypothetical protein